MFDKLIKSQRYFRPSVDNSVSLSVISIILITIVWAAIFPERVLTMYEYRKVIIRIDFLNSYYNYAAYFLLFVIVPVNFFGDYISIWQSRVILNRLRKPTKIYVTFSFLFLDLILSAAIFFVLWFALEIFYSPASMSPVDSFYRGANTFFVSNTLFFAGPTFDSDIIAICFYAKLTTSIWVWVFVFGGWFWSALRRVIGILDVTKYPIGSAMSVGGFVFGTVVTLTGYIS